MKRKSLSSLPIDPGSILVADASVVINLNATDRAREIIRAFPGKFVVTNFAYKELLAGARGDEDEDVIDRFLRDFRVVDVPRGVAREAVALRRSHRLRLPDAIIWASARTESALLVTRNTKDFPKQEPGVRVPY